MRFNLKSEAVFVKYSLDFDLMSKGGWWYLPYDVYEFRQLINNW